MLCCVVLLCSFYELGLWRMWQEVHLRCCFNKNKNKTDVGQTDVNLSMLALPCMLFQYQCAAWRVWVLNCMGLWCIRSCMCIQEQNYFSTTIPSVSYRAYLKQPPMVTWTLYRMLSATGGHSQLKYCRHPLLIILLVHFFTFLTQRFGKYNKVMFLLYPQRNDEIIRIVTRACYVGDWSKSMLQVKIRCVEKCPNLLLKAFKEAISENFEKKGNKFKYDLNETQVCISCMMQVAKLTHTIMMSLHI